MRIIGIILAIIVALIIALPVIAAENIMQNPSAEEVAADGKPAGWGLYIGSGEGSLSVSSDEKRTGDTSACLELSGWYLRPNSTDAPQNRMINIAAILAPNNGYLAAGAMECRPRTDYAFTLWYKGTLPRCNVMATGWPTAEADQTLRGWLPVSGGIINPSDEWQRCAGTLRTGADTTRFAIWVQATGVEAHGMKLGRLYIDDVEVLPRPYPDGEIRGVWWWGVRERQDAEAGKAEIVETLDRLKSIGINTVFISLNSMTIAAFERPEVREKVPGSEWDYFGEMVKAAAERGIQPHAWYAPWTYKNPSRSIEMQDHPEWAAVGPDGAISDNAICFVRPEVRQYQLDLMASVMDHCPQLAGIHIEEPGHTPCRCEYCQAYCKDYMGMDITQSAGTAAPEIESMLRNLTAFASTDFIARLRQKIIANRPEMWLSANGSAGPNPDWSIGRDWSTWARRGYIDFYVPQIYTESVEKFAGLAAETQVYLGPGTMVTGMAASWSTIYPDRQDPQVMAGQIAAARETGARGFVIFRVGVMEDGHFGVVEKAAGG